MFGRVFFLGIVMVLGVFALTSFLTDPTRSYNTYEKIIDPELPRQADGSYQKALVVISRANLAPNVQDYLQDIYAKSNVRLQFVSEAELTPAYLKTLAATGLPVHGFGFSSLHYRNGWPGVDVTHLTATASDHYTAHLNYVNGSEWQIVEKVPA